MANRKGTRSRNSRKTAFPEVKGKTVERLELFTAEGCSIGILFQDKTYLAFDVDPFLRITPDFSDWKTGDYKRLKRWRPVHSK